jgi:putative Mg2+ transporter-C (MgtC) family protein
VGAEREKKNKPTGIRTLTMVGLGAAVFTMISFGPAAAISPAGVKTDVGRIAAQIVSGVGFLGAGAILRGRFSVAGLTSAATIWVVAANGMLVGAGYGGGGLALAGFILILLTTVSAWEQRVLGGCKYATASILFESLGGKTSIRIEELLDEYQVPPKRRKEVPPFTGSPAEGLNIEYCYVHRHHREFLVQLAELPEVREIDRGHVEG